MSGSTRNRTTASTWLRASLVTAALAATAVLSTGCVPFMVGGAVVVTPV
jgi:hypothetical protein